MTTPKIKPPKFVLNEQHRQCIVHFLNGMTKKEAIVKAGFSKWLNANTIFDRDDVKTEIARRQKQMSTKSGVTAEWIIERLKSIADADLSQLLEVNEEGEAKLDMRKLTPDLRRALGSFKSDGYGSKVFKMDVKLTDKLKALEMLGRHLSLFNDKIEVNAEQTLVEALQAGRARASGEKEEEDAPTHGD